MRRAAKLVVVAAIMGFASLAVAAPAPSKLPPALAAEVAGLQRFSEARFHKFVWHVYDASLWIGGERWDAAMPYALEIRYAIGVKGADLARRSVEEMRGQGIVDTAKLERWEQQMRRVFPDITSGDRLVGLAIPGRETRFYTADRLAGVIADAEFTAAFFAIWLGERTSEPQLRRELLRLP